MEDAPHLNGNFLKDRIQCPSFRNPKGRLHDFAMSPVRVAFTGSRSVSLRKWEEPFSHLPRSEHHRRLLKRKAQAKQEEGQENTVTYKSTVQILGDPQA